MAAGVPGSGAGLAGTGPWWSELLQENGPMGFGKIAMRGSFPMQMPVSSHAGLQRRNRQAPARRPPILLTHLLMGMPHRLAACAPGMFLVAAKDGMQDG